MKNIYLLVFSILFCVASQAQVTKYAKPDNPNTGNGTQGNPYQSIAKAVNKVKQQGGGTVIIIDGTYDMGTGNSVKIPTAATAATAVTIKPQTPGGVTLKFDNRSGFDFTSTSRYITLQGIELYGQTDVVDYWTIVAKAFWGDSSVPRKSGIAVLLNGQHITVEDCYIHDWYQKACEIKDGRYITIKGNIIHDIATTSLSGGHGIMRQQKGKEFFTDDTPGVYRWDISENLLFRVEQRIYSWVPKKGFIEMTIDEGKSILIDDPKDTDNNQEAMTARIKNNIVAYGSVVAIRIKSTPGLEVSNNSVLGIGDRAEGITDKSGDTNTPQFTDFICKNNAVQTVSNIFAFQLSTAVSQGGNTIDISGNYAMHGKVKPTNLIGSGVTRNTNSNESLFTDPANGDFSINPSLGLPSTLGVSSGVRTAIGTKVNLFNVQVGPDPNYVHDNLKLSQTIFDNIPKIYDGIPGNETVYADYGTVNLGGAHPKFKYNVVNGQWKSDTNSPNTQEMRLNDEYLAWYQSIKSAHSGYPRYRWGDTEIMQDFIFPSNWLTECRINSASDYTVTNGHNKTLTLDGDLLINFNNYTPAAGVGLVFDLMKANSIVSNNGSNLFNNVIFEGYIPTNYTLEVVTEGGKDILRLIINPNALAVNDETLKNTSLKVVPNPAKDAFLLKTKNSFKSLKMFDLLGREVTHKMSVTPVQNGYQFNVAHLSSGVYIVKADENAIRVVVK